MKVLITLGPTQEPIDDVRYISNRSSGKMGAALAYEAIKRCHQVALVHGPVSIELPDCKKIPVTTAQEMADATLSELKKGYDIMISSAAIADFSPKKVEGKIKGGSSMALELKPAPKLIDLARKKFPKLFLVAFKAEVGLSRKGLSKVASEYLSKKNLQMVVANDVKKGVFGADENSVVVATKGSVKDLGGGSKVELAKRIFDEIDSITNYPVKG